MKLLIEQNRRTFEPVLVAKEILIVDCLLVEVCRLTQITCTTRFLDPEKPHLRLVQIGVTSDYMRDRFFDWRGNVVRPDISC